MTTEAQLHQALIKNNFLKDKDSERGFAWIATAMSCGYTDLQVELIGLHAKYFAGNRNTDTEGAIILWGRLTGKVATECNFRECRVRALKSGFKFEENEKVRGNGRNGHKTSYKQSAIYRLAQHTIK